MVIKIILAMNQMTSGLSEKSLKTEQTDWSKSGLNRLSEILLAQSSYTDICQEILSFLATYLEANVGTFYVINEHNALELQASYAFVNCKSIKQIIASGEGIVGEALREASPIVISNIPDDYIVIGSSLGDSSPSALIAVPIVTGSERFGVIELATLAAFSELQIDFLASCAERIATMIRSSRQAENLQKQQEELQISNEELAEQTQKLRSSEEELQVQQEELRATNEELQEKNKYIQKQQNEIEQRNLDLQRAKEEISLKADELEESTKYKSEFLANVSHEVRTPLNSLLVLSRNLMKNRNGNLNEKQVGDLGIIHNSGSELLNLINGILDISKIESGKMNVSMEAVSLSELLHDLDDMFRHVAEDGGVAFEIDVAENVPATIISDKVKLSHILRNLMSNAIKFTSNGDVKLSVRKGEVSPGGDSLANSGSNVVFTVSDTGIGIESTQLEKVFDAFHQADGSTSRNFGGTGLGLSITRSMIDLIGGDISVISEVGKGSCFCITIPVGVESLLEANVVTPSDEDGVLIIDDDAGAAEAIASTLRKKEILSTIVASVPEAVETLNECPYRCAVIDVEIETVDDLELLQRISSASSGPLALVIYTAKTFSDQDLLQLGRGAPVIITKSEHSLKRLQEEIVAIIADDSSLRQDNELENSAVVEDKILNDRKILVVDDDVRNIYTISDLLAPYRLDILKSGNAAHALETLGQEHGIELVITDIMMAGMDGYALIRGIRALARYKELPIIALTAKTMQQDRRECYAAGATDYLTKPIDADKLISTLRVWLNKTEA